VVTHLLSPTSGNVRCHRPFTVLNAVPRLIYPQLSRIKAAVRDRARNGLPNDVVMIYYGGSESADAEGHFLATSDSQDPLRSDFLTSLFGEYQGAQLLLLDVNRKADPSQMRWSEQSRIGMFRYAWLDPYAERQQALISALESALDKSSRLKEVARLLGVQVTEVTKDPKLLKYDSHLPAGLED